MPGGKSEGVFGGAFKRFFPLIPVIDDGRLHDSKLRENFIEKVFVYKRWKDFLKTPKKVGDLVSFHTDLKFLIMAHSPKHYTILGKLVANAKKYSQDELYYKYIHLLMEGLGLIATVKKNTNVLMHIAGYFKKMITADEKQELLELISQFHSGYIPLIVPLVLIKHYVRKYGEPYLARQFYLNPHPIELMLRNHA